MNIETTPQEHRETIVLRAMTLGNLTFEDAEQIDALVCDALGIEQMEEPPEFMLLAQQ
jgi:hypothetical protein